MEPTVVTFPQGSTREIASVVRTEALEGNRLAVVTTCTPFHPVDHTWPDQPADRGTLAGNDVIDCLTGAIDPEGALHVGSAIPARRGEAGWVWVVVHVVAGADTDIRVGQDVALEVDAHHRAALSRAHTACHLAALALNEAAQPLWGKPVDRTDSRGKPDLDALAIVSSRIAADRSIDEYRLGKSIRKKGLDSAALLGDLGSLQEAVTDRVRQWVAAGGQVVIDTGDDTSVAARRTWTCALPDGLASYPCGGTHVVSLADLPLGISVRYDATQDGFRATTLVGGE